ncbi:uncharacterized protein F4812DRAFT_470254 [Daldinia caldariorum]|uniref:uncharacterized protein n=1 Tax=Daldinia caldariorum TaxID=326644 RepID=UPI0020085654|nr:uncharacterized protein F4812DRAFT_470254 [Daldinia caldariorum]KAI1469157.1 hypothetical protein F4812DRAFT_470254 [Daldinia caldariorum]
MPTLPSKEKLASMLVHKDQSLVPDIIVCDAICGIASIVFALLRLYSQYLVSRKLRLTQSDILLLLGLVFYIAFSIALGMITKYGGGRHIILATDTRSLRIWKIIAEVTYTISLGFIKFGILRLYGTIFPSKRFRIFLWIFAICLIAFDLACIMVSVFECIPVQYYWDMSIKGGHCLDYGLYTLLAGMLNIITDLIILLAPIPQVLHLHISKHKKMLLIFTFAMGGSACIVSIVRLPYALDFDSTGDPSYDNIRIGLLSLVELMTGILATSIPTYRPLFRQMMAKYGQSSVDSQKNTYKNSGRTDIRGTLPGQLERNFPVINVTSHIELARYINIGGNWVRVPDEPSHGWR